MGTGCKQSLCCCAKNEILALIETYCGVWVELLDGSRYRSLTAANGYLVFALILFSIPFNLRISDAEAAQAREELGIDRSNLTTQSEAVQEKTLQGIRDLHATWFRDVLSAAAKPENQAKFVNEVRLAKQNNLKMLVNVLPSYLDYDEPFANAGEDFRKMCGWSGGDGKLSQINLTKFAQHLRATLDAVKAANLTIDAFEIGNEFDTTCYDADVPVGHAASEEEIAAWLRGYGEYLKAAALVIRDPNYFPHAKIVTFGIAHGSDQWDKPWRHISHPAAVVARLRNVNGFNYLDNALYHVDGYGTHIYPWPGDIVGSVRGTLTQDAAALGRDKPFWVTEWGFLSKSSFPTQKGETLGQGIGEILATFDSLAPGIPLGPVLFYRYDVWLTDKTGQLLPEASVLSDYAARH
jgi:hypothetical protein